MTDVQQTIANGQAAEQLLGSSAFRLAFDDARNAALEGIALTKPSDADTREFLYSIVRALPFVEQAIRARITDGLIELDKIIKAQQEEQRKSSPRSGQKRTMPPRRA